MYHLRLSRADIHETDLKELDWLHGRLAQQKTDEAEAFTEAVTGRKRVK